MSRSADLFLAPDRWPSLAELSWPLAFVDLGRWPADFLPSDRSPIPLVGSGAADHPFAPAMDAVLEPPVTMSSLLQRVEAAPNAASVAVHLLRTIENLPVDRALAIESMAYGLLQASQEHRAWLASRTPPPAAEPGRVPIDRSGSTLFVTLDRPSARNAIDRTMRDELFEAFTIARLDPDLRRIHLRATGPAFSIGGDLAEFGTTRDAAEAHLIRSRTLPALPFSSCADRASVHIQGACIGAGLELAAFASHISATSNAWFQLPELSMGLVPGAGGCVSLSRRIGRQRTALMILSGKRIAAAKALEWGLVDALVDDPPADNGSPDEN